MTPVTAEAAWADVAQTPNMAESMTAAKAVRIAVFSVKG